MRDSAALSAREMWRRDDSEMMTRRCVVVGLISVVITINMMILISSVVTNPLK
jgi:hypothetical protein